MRLIGRLAPSQGPAGWEGGRYEGSEGSKNFETPGIAPFVRGWPQVEKERERGITKVCCRVLWKYTKARLVLLLSRGFLPALLDRGSPGTM